MWFDDIRLELEDTRLRISTRTPFAASWIRSHYAEDVSGAARETTGSDLEVEIHAAPERFDASPPIRSTVPGDLADEPRRGPDRASPGVDPARLRKLDDFVVGDCNRLAHLGAQRLSDPAVDPPSPLFLHGGCGLGKTHLLQGIRRRWPTARARYVTAEQFTNEFIAAVRTASIDAFRARIRSLDLLVIDDVHFLTGNQKRTRQELLHTLDAILLSGARVALAANEAPEVLTPFSEALVSRLRSGMVVQLEPPDVETRISLLRRLAQRRRLTMHPAAGSLLARHRTGSVRMLEGALSSLAAMASLEGRDAIGVTLVEQLLQTSQATRAAPIMIESVIDAVCSHLGVSRQAVLGRARHRRLVMARAIVARLGRDMTCRSYPEIARALGRRSHSSVHASVRRLAQHMERSPTVLLGDEMVDLPDLLERIRQSLRPAA